MTIVTEDLGWVHRREVIDVEATVKAPGDSCLTCANRAQSSWRVLSEEELERVDRARRVRAYEPGD